jgi:thioesterase domain-containing protein
MYDAQTTEECAQRAAAHIVREHGSSRFCITGYSLGCVLSYDLYLALVSAGADVIAMVVLDYPVDFPVRDGAALDEAAIENQVALVLASHVMDDPWALPHHERAELKGRLLDVLPTLEPRFASATRWMSMLQGIRAADDLVRCPVLLVCSGDAHPLFRTVVRPDLIEASWRRITVLRPLVQLISGCHHASIISEPGVGGAVAHFLCSVVGTSCSADRLSCAMARSERRAHARLGGHEPA